MAEKRILSISPWPSLWVMVKGGGSPSEVYAIEAMQEAGFTVTHLTPSMPGQEPIVEGDGIRFVRISNPFLRLRFLNAGPGFLYRLAAISWWTALVSAWLRKSGERFNLVVGHGLESSFLLRRIGRYLGIPAIARLYGISVDLDKIRRGLRRELYFDLMNILRNPPHHIILTDDGTRGDKAAELFGIEASRYDFLVNGYDPRLLRAVCQETKPPFVLTASRLVEEKRIDRVVRIASRCKDNLPHVKFVILGDGPMRPRLQRQIFRMDLESTVCLQGSVCREIVHQKMRQAALILSTQDVSNVNNTVLESMVLGKPVVTLDVGGTGNFISDGKTGLLFDPDDIDSIADGIVELINDQSLRRQLGENARDAALKLLKPWPDRVRQEADIYRRFC